MQVGRRAVLTAEHSETEKATDVNKYCWCRLCRRCWWGRTKHTHQILPHLNSMPPQSLDRSGASASLYCIQLVHGESGNQFQMSEVQDRI